MKHRKPLWDITELIFQVDCLNVTTAIHSETEEEYLVAVTCGRVTSEPAFPERNVDVGEYACMAFQEKAGKRNQMESSYLVPCQYIQLGECGCAPDDVYTWGLDPPMGPCRTTEDCPFLCSDTGPAKSKNLCHAFGGPDWWTGDNFMGLDVFVNHQKTNHLAIYSAP